MADKQIRGLCYWPWDLSNCHSSHSSYIRYSGLCLRLLLPLVNLGKGSNFNFFPRKAFSIYSFLLLCDGKAESALTPHDAASPMS